MMMEEASAALTAGEYFDCEHIADEALHMAWQRQEYGEMARILLPLQEARRQRRLAAVDADHVRILESGLPSPGSVLQPGIYIVQPPQVGADAMALRHAALTQKIPVIALAVEPVTRMGLLPVVSVGPVVLRTRVPQPARIDASWVLEAIDCLTSQAIAALDTTRPLGRQIDILVDDLDALPESELLHQRLMETCIAAARQPRDVTNPAEGPDVLDDVDDDDSVDAEDEGSSAHDALEKSTPGPGGPDDEEDDQPRRKSGQSSAPRRRRSPRQ